MKMFTAAQWAAMVRYCTIAVDSGGLVLEQAAEAVLAPAACPVCDGVGIHPSPGWPRCTACGGLGKQKEAVAVNAAATEAESLNSSDLAYLAGELSRVSESSTGLKMRLNGRDWISWD